MKKINFRKQYLACAVLAAVCTGFIYTPQVAEAKFGAGATISTFDTKDVVTFVGKSWYVVGQSNAGGEDNKITLFCKDVWSNNLIKFNEFVNGTNVFNDYGSVSYNKDAGRGESGSILMQEMKALYDGLEAGTAKSAIQEVNLNDVNVTGVYFYAPSKEEVTAYKNMTLPGDVQFPSDNSVARATADYWTRSPDSATNKENANYYSATGLSIAYESATSGQFALRPVIQVDQAAAGSTLVNTDPTKTSGSYFSSKVNLETNGTFVGDTGSSDPHAYTSVADTAPKLDCTYLVLDGTSIKVKLDGAYTGINNGTVEDPNYCTTVGAVLVNEDTSQGGAVMAGDSTFTNIDGKIDYIATLESADGTLNGSLSNVSNGTTYGLKIFGIDNTNYKATQLGSGVINKIEKTDTGLNLTIGLVNTGFTSITLSNGAGVTLDADAENTDIGVAGDIVNIALGSYKLKGINGDVPSGATVNVTSSEGSFGTAITNKGTVNVKGSTTFNGFTNNDANAKLTITEAGTTKFAGEDKQVINKGEMNIDSASVIFSGAVTNSKTMNVKSTDTIHFNKTFTNENGGTLTVEGTSTFTGAVTNDGTMNIKGNATFSAGISGSVSGVWALNINSGNTKVTGDLVQNAVTVDSGASLAVGAGNLKSAVTNNGTVKLGEGAMGANTNAKIVGGNVEIGIVDGTAETVSVKVSQFENAPLIKINSNDTLKFMDAVTEDKTFAVSGTGKLDVTTSGDGKIVLTGDNTTLAGITITTGNLQIPAGWILDTSGGAGNYEVTEANYVTGNNGVLTLRLSGDNKWRYQDLLTLKNTTTMSYTGTVKFAADQFDDEGAPLSIKASSSGEIDGGKIGVYEVGSGSSLIGDEAIDAPTKFVTVAQKESSNDYTGEALATDTVKFTNTTGVVAKGLKIDRSGSANLQITGNAEVTLVGETNGNYSTPLVDKDENNLSTKVVVDAGSTFNVGYSGYNGKMEIDTLTDNGTVNMVNSDLNITGSDGIAIGSGAEFNMNDGTLTAEQITGSGTFNGNSGKLYVKKSSVPNLTLGGGLEVHISLPTAHLAADFDGSVINGVFYNVNTSFTGGANLIIDDGSLDLGSYYVIVSGDAVNTDGDNHNIFGSISCNDASMEIVPVSAEALEGTGLTLDKFKNMIVLKTTEGDILLHEKKLEPYYPVMEAIKDDTGSEANKLYADLKNAYRKNHKGGVAAMESLLGQPNVASMFKSGLQVASLISNATLDHTSLVERDVNYSTNHYKPSLRNMVADSPDMDSDPEYIGVGKVTDIMPYRSSKSSSQSNYSSPRSSVGRQSAYNRTVQRDYYSNYEEERRTSRPAVDRYSKSSYGGGKSYGSLKNLQSYSGSDANKQVWAAYLHSKEDIDGLQTGGTEREGTNTTNGAVVGADLWSTEHAFGGLSVSYATTDVETANDFSKITNDVKSYGIGIYHRHDYRRGAMIFDGGFTHNKNEIKQEMNLANSYEIKSKPKVEIFDAGLRYEHKCHVDENAAVVPYIGVRYTMVDPDSYCNNIGIRYGTRHDDIVSIPLGLRLSVNWHTSDSVIVKPYVDLGYKWNMGQDNWRQKVTYGNATSMMKYDVLDKNSFFLNAGLQVISDTFTFGAGYQYTSSDNVKNKQWTINANWEM